MNITRQQQLLAQMKRIISTELLELNHELFHGVVVTYVHLSNDGRECRIFVNGPQRRINDLNTKYRPAIHRAFIKQFAKKVIPHLIFVKDEGDVEHLGSILESEHSSHE